MKPHSLAGILASKVHERPNAAERQRRDIVQQVEAIVAAAPAQAFHFADGFATLRAAGREWSAGRFSTPSLTELRARCAGEAPGAPAVSIWVRLLQNDAARNDRGSNGAAPISNRVRLDRNDPTRMGRRSKGATPVSISKRTHSAEAIPGGCVRLSALTGASPLADIGALQAQDDGLTVFQAASQFNCLEAPGPALVPVAAYFGDPTQGPRAAISAFPGTLLRHYSAPAGEGEPRFVQGERRQVELLGDVLAGPRAPARVQSGYLRAQYVSNPEHLSELLQDRFDAIRIGIHEDVEVARGANWDGPVPSPAPRITQVWTSTFAGGGYSPGLRLGESWGTIMLQLLKAAYLGTLLAAVCTGKQRVLLTLIGGGVFGNPPELIGEAILWALAEVDKCGTSLDVVVNCWDRDADFIADAIQARGGRIIELP